MTTEFILRIFIAGLLGGAIGLEREYRAKEAGFRTHFLVGLGSGLFMILSAHGFSDVIRRIFSDGFTEAFRNVRLVRPEDVIQFYLNIVVFIPLGYLLPYVFRWCRQRVRMRPALVCFLLSFLVENVQLMSRRGLYDLDDIIANTIGGIIGEFLYISFAYMLTHPAWKDSLHGYQAWRRQALRKTLYSFRRGIAVSRTVLYTAEPDKVMEFYTGRLGFRLIARLRDKEAGTQVILYANAEPSEAVEKMPDLHGLSYSIARQRLGFYGLFINTNVMSRIDAEHMLVSWQSVETDEEIKHGTVITVSLVDSDSSMDGRY